MSGISSLAEIKVDGIFVDGIGYLPPQLVEPEAHATCAVLYYFVSGVSPNQIKSLRVKFPGDNKPHDLQTEVA